MAKTTFCYYIVADFLFLLVSFFQTKKLKSEGSKWERKPQVEIGQWYLDVVSTSYYIPRMCLRTRFCHFSSFSLFFFCHLSVSLVRGDSSCILSL